MSLISEQLDVKIGRRNLLQIGGLAGASLLGGALLAGCGGSDSNDNNKGNSSSSTDAAVLNFALNLEYLEAAYYQAAVIGNADAVSSGGSNASISFKNGSTKVTFDTTAGAAYAAEIAQDELNHVNFLRTALQGSAVARPPIDLFASFNAAITAASKGAVTTFDPFASETNFLLGAFIFEDVGVTAYKGGSTLISNKTYLSAAAGILAVEAYHAATVRLLLSQRGTQTVAGTGLTVFDVVQAISDLRDQASGVDLGLDQGLDNGANIVPTDSNSIAFTRTTTQVLPIVYLGGKVGTGGGFFPTGLNGAIK